MLFIKRVTTTAVKALMTNTARSVLTMLGIVIGVAAVITMQAVGAGTRQDVTNEIAGLGVNLIVVTPSAAMEEGVRSDAGSARVFKRRHTQELLVRCPSLAHVSAFMMAPAQVMYRSENWRTSVVGAESGYFAIRNLQIRRGTALTSEHDRQAAQVCVIGQTVAEGLFGSSDDPIGKTLRVNHVPFKVIGLLRKKGQSGIGQDQDDIVIAPLLTLQKRMTEDEYVQQIFASARTENLVAQAVAELRSTLKDTLARERRASEEFTIDTTSDIGEAAGRVTRSLSYLLATMAGISLFVGGIGIMNIMLVSVTERTREIGLRLAVGATPFDVWFQLLVEAVILSILAGMIGISVGLLLCAAIRDLIGWSTITTSGTIALAFLVSTAVGIFFGWYPARRAAALNPIDALRHE